MSHCHLCGEFESHKHACVHNPDIGLPDPTSFQARVHPWMLECFGEEIAADRMERNHRFFEEATELVQANGMTRSEAHQLVDYTFSRPIGEIKQEAGGVMVTFAALCKASGIDMHQAGETELARVWTMVEPIRAKQAAKPKHSPLPGYSAPAMWEAASEPVAYLISWLGGRREVLSRHPEVPTYVTDAVTTPLYAQSAPAVAGEAVPVWRCFHCDEMFNDPESAMHHFGKSERQEPICFVDQKKYRDLQVLAASYQDEDTDLHQELRRMRSEHAQALIREEEKGYAKALRDTNYQEPAAPQGENP